MAGAFVRSKYETDGGQIVNVKIQPETLACTIDSTANAAPTGAVTAGFPSARVGGSRRMIGINTRTVTLAFTAAVPDGYKDGGTLTIPALTPAFYAKCTTGATGTYLENAVQVVGRSAEAIK